MSVAKLGPEQDSFKTKQETGEEYGIIGENMWTHSMSSDRKSRKCNRRHKRRRCVCVCGGQTGLLFITDELTVWSLPSHLTLEDFCISLLFTWGDLWCSPETIYHHVALGRREKLPHSQNSEASKRAEIYPFELCKIRQECLWSLWSRERVPGCIFCMDG